MNEPELAFVLNGDYRVNGLACTGDQMARCVDGMVEWGGNRYGELLFEPVNPEDASFTLKGLNELFSIGLTDDELAGLSAELGSDCPFFVYNRPMMGGGRGEILTPYDFSLEGRRLDVVPQPVFVSTREAYAGIVPRNPAHSLTWVLKQPVEQWKDLLVNDFETTVFARYPQLAEAKQRLYEEGAIYASMSGSGSALFAIY